MRHPKSVFAALLIAGLAGGVVSAQPAPDGEPPDDGTELPDVTATGEAEAKLSPREMKTEADRILAEMEGMHVRVLELQKSARKAKDVLKLNCVNESLMAVKQLLNIAEAADNDLTEAIAGGDIEGQVHFYGQVKLAHERSVGERDDAEACIGDEIVFIGPTDVQVDGPAMPDDPTDDGDDPFASTSIVLEHAAYATPF
jgi:hypothetical protein